MRKSRRIYVNLCLVPAPNQGASMLAFIASYFSILVSLLFFDGLWLGLFMGKMFKKHLGHVMASNLTWWPIPTFYALYAFGIVYFILRNSEAESLSLSAIFGRGMLFGLVAYATYDLTNQATIAKWPILITLVDICWGSFYTGVAALVGSLILKIVPSI